jgi:AcrR family transcriptional regulator
MTVATTPDQKRRDARDNREAILEAARALFADSADVAMSQVARRAGVGQATLYRNFPSRGALAAVILDEHVERLAAIADEHEGEADAFFVLLRGLIDGMVSLYGLGALARRDEEMGTQLDASRRRVAELLKGPLCDAKAAGTLRRDFSTEDLFLLLSMGRGAMEGLSDPGARSGVAHRMLALILGGIEQPGA